MATMIDVAPPVEASSKAETLAHRLERQRLLHRERRLAGVLRGLRADVLVAEEPAERPQLRATICDFHGMLAAVQRRLDELDRLPR